MNTNGDRYFQCKFCENLSQISAKRSGGAGKDDRRNKLVSKSSETCGVLNCLRLHVAEEKTRTLSG